MIEVFKKIIVAVPFGTPINYVFEAAYHFLALLLPKIEGSDTTELAFWKFLVKEISLNDQNRAIVQNYAQILQRYYPKFNSFDDAAQRSEILSVVDEYLLLLRELPFE
jgi:hypothetical protein